MCHIGTSAYPLRIGKVCKFSYFYDIRYHALYLSWEGFQSFVYLFCNYEKSCPPVFSKTLFVWSNYSTLVCVTLAHAPMYIDYVLARLIRQSTSSWFFQVCSMAPSMRYSYTTPPIHLCLSKCISIKKHKWVGTLKPSRI